MTSSYFTQNPYPPQSKLAARWEKYIGLPDIKFVEKLNRRAERRKKYMDKLFDEYCKDHDSADDFPMWSHDHQRRIYNGVFCTMFPKLKLVLYLDMLVEKYCTEHGSIDGFFEWYKHDHCGGRWPRLEVMMILGYKISKKRGKSQGY